MYDFLKKIKTNALITSCIYTLLGLVLLFWPTLSTNLLSMSLGAVLLVCGVVDILIFLANRRDGTLFAAFHLILGIILSAVGFWLMSKPTLIAVVIPRIIGILICIHGCGDISDAMVLRKNKYGRWTTVALLGLVAVLLGALLVVCPFKTFTTVVRLIGVFLLYDGITGIYVATRISKVTKSIARETASQDTPIEDMPFQDVPFQDIPRRDDPSDGGF